MEQLKSTRKIFVSTTRRMSIQTKKQTETQHNNINDKLYLTYESQNYLCAVFSGCSRLKRPLLVQ